MRFGEYLIKKGRIEESELENALKLQKENRDLLGEILVLHGAISKMDMEEELRQFYELKGRNKE
ncbi:MAG: hypothetical protein ACYSR1_06085 [Planctomycetota bacterium]|jgi:hypothetical protein